LSIVMVWLRVQCKWVTARNTIMQILTMTVNISSHSL